MFWSRSSSQSSDASSPTSQASGSTASTSSESIGSSSSVDQNQHWESRGAAGLGVISSLAPECTPLKHRYDSCFDLWFRDYLAIGDSQISQQEHRHAATSAYPKNDDSSASSTDTRKRKIMERYERDCGALFRDYQACVKRAVSQRDLDGLITAARKENPFPFDHERESDRRGNNPPFPFPAARE